MAELSQEALERMVVGAPVEPFVSFYDEAELDMVASQGEGRRIYRKAIYIKVRAPGVTDWVSYRAQPEDITKYPREYSLYKRTQQGKKPISVEIIPDLDVTHLHELIDLNLATLPELAAAEVVPPHLEYAREYAVAICNIMKEKANGTVTNGQIERNGTGITAGPVLPETAGQVNAGDVGRPDVPDCDTLPEPDLSRGIYTGGRNDQGRNPIDNWAVSFH